MKNHRTNRLLLLFDYCYFSELISMEDLDEFFEFYTPLDTSFHHRTYNRDLQFLKDAGLIHLKYARSKRCYVHCESREDFLPKFPENKTQRRYMEKIIRLCTLMTDMFSQEMDDFDPTHWYRERYLDLSNRTRQRDFNKLREIGYDVDSAFITEENENGGKYYYQYLVYVLCARDI